MAIVKCPNCGGENDINNKSGQECEYCGTMLQYPSFTSETNSPKGRTNNGLSSQKFIVPLKTEYDNDGAVSDALKAYLTNTDDVPADIFDHLEVKMVKRIYLPFWRFSGKVETEWSCNQIIYKKRKIGEKPVRDRNGNLIRMEAEYETYKDYLPKSGHGNGRFDILVPAANKPKERVPFFTQNFNLLRSSFIAEFNGEVEASISASVRKVTLENSSEKVLGNVAVQMKSLADSVSFANISPRTDETMTFNYAFNENGEVGQLYYLPFVYVVYSYKGGTYDWGFVISPQHCIGEQPTVSEDSNEASVEERINEIEEERQKFNTKYNIFLFLSGVLSFLIGMLFFLMRNYSLHERINKRLKYQKSFVSLFDKLQRRENLARHGASEKQLKAIDEDLFDGYDDSYADSEDDITPKSTIAIQNYFSETEYLKEKLTKRMKRFWLWYILLIIFVGGGIGGYYYWDKAQTEKMCHQEYEERMAKISQLEEELNATITSEFAEKFIGKTFEGSLSDETASGGYRFTGFDAPKLTIRFLDKSNLTCNGKKYAYELEIKGNIVKDSEYQAEPEVILKWGNYKTENIVDCLGKLNEPFNHIPFKTYFKVIQGDDVYLMSRVDASLEEVTGQSVVESYPEETEVTEEYPNSIYIKNTEIKENEEVKTQAELLDDA